MDASQKHKDYEHKAKAFANVAKCIPPRIIDNAYGFSIKNADKKTEDLELDYCPKSWRDDRNFVDILANPTVREWIFETVAELARHPDKTRTLLHECGLDATAEGEEFMKQIFYMLCMALVSVIYIKKHLAVASASGVN